MKKFFLALVGIAIVFIGIGICLGLLRLASEGVRNISDSIVAEPGSFFIVLLFAIGGIYIYVRYFKSSKR